MVESERMLANLNRLGYFLANSSKFGYVNEDVLMYMEQS